jgi:hypothetical protein
MLYNELIEYDEPYFQYNGVRIVEPNTFGPTSVISNLDIRKVVLLHPESITSTLIFVAANKVIVGTGKEQVTQSTASLTFETYDSGYIAFNVEKREAFAVSSAETIILEYNSAGTADVTIIQTS